MANLRHHYFTGISIYITHLMSTKMLGQHITTRTVWNHLMFNIRNASKVVLMDATLQDTTVDVLCKSKSVWKIQNTYKSYANTPVTILHDKVEGMRLVKRLVVDEKKRIVIPTNSNTDAKAIYEDLIRYDNNLEILLINSEYTSGHTVDSTTWNKYDVLIYTPSIVAGISFDQFHYHQLVGFFCLNSTDVEQTAQQLLRVRKLIDGQITLVLPKDQWNPHAISDTGLNQYIDDLYNGKVELGARHLALDGLDLEEYQMKVLHSDFYYMLRHVVKKQKTTSVAFTTYLRSVLEMHGMSVTIDTEEVDKPDDEYEEIKSNMKDMKEIVKMDDAKAVSEAPDITRDEFRALSKSTTRLTVVQQRSLMKERYRQAFNVYGRDVTPEELLENYKHRRQHVRKKEALGKDLVELYELSRSWHEDVYTEELIKEQDSVFKKEEKAKANIECPSRLPTKNMPDWVHKRRMRVIKGADERSASNALSYNPLSLKMGICLRILKVAGFDRFDTNYSVGIQWKALVEYLNEVEGDIRTLWNTKKRHMSLMEDEIQGRRNMIQYINSKLKDIYAISIKRDRLSSEYCIVFD